MLAMLRSPSLLPPKPDSLSARLRQPFGPQHLRVTHRAGPTGQQPALGLGTGLGTALEPCMLPWGGGAGCSKEGRRQPCVGTARGPVPPPQRCRFTYGTLGMGFARASRVMDAQSGAAGVTLQGKGAAKAFLLLTAAILKVKGAQGMPAGS